MAQDAGGIIDNSGLTPFDQAFFAFEVESPLGTLKEVPIWDEIEQMLDNPYAFALEPNVEGNPQGWSSYRSTQQRRRSFIFRNAVGEPCAPLTAGCNEVPLAGHLIHPLNYNHSTGEELRLLNIGFEEAPWTVEDQLLPVPGAPGEYEFTYRDIVVSAGELRIEEEEAAIDFNTPIRPDLLYGPDGIPGTADDGTFATIVSVDAFFVPGPSPAGSVQTAEGSLITGAEPGEPGYAGFGTLLAVGAEPGRDEVPSPQRGGEESLGHIRTPGI